MKPPSTNGIHSLVVQGLSSFSTTEFSSVKNVENLRARPWHDMPENDILTALSKTPKRYNSDISVTDLFRGIQQDELLISA